ncbi:MAG TPA: hypothetical protein VNQ76_07910, partial [Planctomicrobium sp.]|nr:hypothetical protein [Planctomicrobium sp.]
ASSDMESLLKSTGATDSERIQGRIALLSLPNGDRISLVDAAQGPRPVVFVPSTDSGKGRIISDSFDQFLSDWEQLCYITPSLTNLVPWLDPVSGRLNPHHGKAAQLREFLTTMASGKRGSP